MIDRISLSRQSLTDDRVTGGAVERRKNPIHLCDGYREEGAAKEGRASLGDQTRV